MVKNFVVKCAFAFLLASMSFAASAQAPTAQQAQEQMLKPSVQIAAGDALGSGTVLFSGTHEGKHRTIIVTNHHVISSSYKFVTEWDDAEGKDKKVRKSVPVQVVLYAYTPEGVPAGETRHTAKVIASSSSRDIAILELTNSTIKLPVGRIAPEGTDIPIGEPVWAVGGGLGLPPFLGPQGALGIQYYVDGQLYNLATASIAPGNSGGGLWRRNPDGVFEVVGVPTLGSSRYAHVGFVIPISEVRAFLRSNRLEFVPGAVAKAKE